MSNTRAFSLLMINIVSESFLDVLTTLLFARDIHGFKIIRMKSTALIRFGIFFLCKRWYEFCRNFLRALDLDKPSVLDIQRLTGIFVRQFGIIILNKRMILMRNMNNYHVSYCIFREFDLFISTKFSEVFPEYFQ